MDRVILHSDLNGFYASVECLNNPEIRNKPVAVCGSIENRHGIMLAKNEHAKKYNLKTGEAIWQIKQKCPHVVIVEPHFDRYMRFSKMAKDIYKRYTDKIESFGLDECWLDVSASTSIFGSGDIIANEIRQTIYNELGITVSVGVAWNKIFAKLGSDMKKPNAVTVITKDNYKDKVWSLPVGDLLYVGRATNKKLNGYGIYSIGQLANTDEKILKSVFGKWSETLWVFSNGLDSSQVADMDSSYEIKSIGNSMTTFRDMECDEDVWCVFVALSESVAQRLRENGFKCRTVQISIRDKSLVYFERQAKLETPSCTSSDIATLAMKIFKSNYQTDKAIRSIGVRGCDLMAQSEIIQFDLFNKAGNSIKREKIEKSIDYIRSRFGSASLQRAVMLTNDIVKGDTKIQHEIHPVSYWR